MTEIIKVNLKFGKYHLLEELKNQETMLAGCANKREEALVQSMERMLAEAYRQKREGYQQKEEEHIGEASEDRC